MLEKIKKLIFSNPKILALVSSIYNLNSLFRIRTNSKNKLNYSKAFLRSTSIKAKKKKNLIQIMNGAYLNSCSVAVYGENNKIIIGENCRLKDVEIHIEDNNNEVIIGSGTTIAGKTHLACIEGTKILIGQDCMFSKDIVFRTGDSHSIVDENGKRINPSKDIYVGNHVWVGNGVIVTKGGGVGDNSIIGTGTIVTKSWEKSNVILAGAPAKIVKENTNWLRKRI